MEGIFEYWPFIFAIIAYLFRGRKNKKRKVLPGRPDSKRAPEPMEETSAGEDPFKKMLDDFLKPKESEKSIDEKMTIPEEKELSVSEKIEQLKNTEKPKKEKPLDTEEKRPEIEKTINLSQPFDLKQAVINEAILNRPY
ncbi:MAG: hypothetical protein VXX63_02760 [Bacteroidota bacterium]|nr:hypothetical protein [Bacteroidota bacterium]